MKNVSNSYLPIILIVVFGLSCSLSGDEYNELDSVEQSGGMICLLKRRLSSEYRVSRPLTKAALFLYGAEYKPPEFPNLVVRNCAAYENDLMILGADDGSYIWFQKETGGYELKKINASLGVPSNNLPWFVEQDRRTNALTGETIMFRGKLPSEYIGNAPDWKTIVAEGENLVEENLISIFLLDTETGAISKRFVKRANYMFLLDSISGGDGIGRHFGWVPDANGKYQMAYPVLEPEKTTKILKK